MDERNREAATLRGEPESRTGQRGPPKEARLWLKAHQSATWPTELIAAERAIRWLIHSRSCVVIFWQDRGHGRSVGMELNRDTLVVLARSAITSSKGQSPCCAGVARERSRTYERIAPTPPQ
jgi:hypothetical protein